MDSVPSTEPSGPRSTWAGAIALYALSTAAVALVLTWAYRLWEADPRIPLYYSIGNDNDFILMMVKTISEHGWHVVNPDLGAPGGMDLHDFPMTDTLCWLLVKLVTQGIRDPLMASNVAFLAGYFLVNWTSLLVFRRLGISTPAAFAAALLFTFLPYHYWRGPWHLNLSLYYTLPLALWLVLRVAAGTPLFLGAGHGPAEPRSTRIGRAMGALIVAALISLSGVYYLYFSGFLLVIAFLIAQLRRVSLARAGDVALIFTVLVGSFAAQVSPYLAYRKEHGRNPEAIQRSVGGARQYSMILTYILQPTMGHRIQKLRLADREIARLPDAKIFRTGYPVFDLTNTLGEKHWNTLGFIGDAGFVLLLIALLGCGTKLVDSFGDLDALAKFNVAAFFLGTTGGLGEVVAYLVLPEIRGYTRIAIFIALFSLTAGALVADRVGRWASRSRLGYRVWLVSLSALTVLGLFDQTPGVIAPDYARERAAFASDRNFVRELEARLSPRSMIFQLPYVPLPEAPEMVRDFLPYMHYRPYLHSKTLRWSAGAVKGREGDQRYRELAALPVPEMVTALRKAGYAGLTFHRKGYEAGGAALESELKAALGATPQISDNGELVFFALGSK